MTNGAVDWAAIGVDPRFQEFGRRRRRFFGGLIAVSVGYYFMLSLGAAFFPELFRLRVAGAVNLGVLLVLSEFPVALIIAAIYARRANRQFDRLAEDINREIFKQHARGGHP